MPAGAFVGVDEGGKAVGELLHVGRAVGAADPPAQLFGVAGNLLDEDRDAIERELVGLPRTDVGVLRGGDEGDRALDALDAARQLTLIGLERLQSADAAPRLHRRTCAKREEHREDNGAYGALVHAGTQDTRPTIE